MSGTWIKMRCALMHDPKVKAIGKFIAAQPGFAEWLSGGQICEMQTSEAALRHIVTGALHVTWSVTNEHAKGGKVSDADVTWIDTVTGIVGFGKAMESVGWVKEEGSDLIFPKFDENNTSSAERMRRHRQRHKASRVTSQERHSDASQGVTVTSHVTQEKRREEKIYTHNNGREIPQRFNTPEVLTALEDWARHYQDKHGDPFTFTVRDNLLMDKARLGWDAAKLERCIRASIAAGAKSIFDADESRTKSQSTPPGVSVRQEPQYRQLTPPQRPRKESA